MDPDQTARKSLYISMSETIRFTCTSWMLEIGVPLQAGSNFSHVFESGSAPLGDFFSYCCVYLAADNSHPIIEYIFICLLFNK
jgi:hypothetical protein